MKTLITSLAIVVLFSLAGCKHEPPTRTIALLDISASIYPEEVDREFAEMLKVAKEMKRGDKLVLYPITGNARNELPGHILQLSAPTARTAYDSDMTAFRKRAGAQIEGMRDWAKGNPGHHTDILGTLEIASHEIDQEPDKHTVLIVISDFLEDDGRYDFITNHSLNSTASARALAESEAVRRQLNLQSARIQLLRLYSRDGASLSPSHIDAVDAFWGEFLTPR